MSIDTHLIYDTPSLEPFSFVHLLSLNINYYLLNKSIAN